MYVASKSFNVSQKHYSYFRSITEGLSRADYKLFCHFFVSSLFNNRNKGWLSIPMKFIQSKFRNADPERLQEKGLIRIDRHYEPKRQSRRYRIEDWVLNGYIELVGDEDIELCSVNIVSGKAAKKAANLDTVFDSDCPELVGNAIGMFPICFFDQSKAFLHTQDLRRQYLEKQTYSSMCRFLNDWIIYQAIRQNATPTNEASIFSYVPTYTMQATGRIGTAAQSASRAMKQAMYGSIPNLHNYDLSSSQMVLCHHEMKRHGIFCNWIETYMSEPGKRDEFARYVDVSVDTWKKCLYAVLMTGHLPTHTKYKESPVIETLEKVTTPETIDATLQRLREALAPLVADLKSWHKIIKAECLETGYLTNALGITRPKESFEKTAGMIAHILQGLEAYFIHTLTILADRYDFQPIVNEHDGLITIGAIPNEAIKEAQEVTGLRCLAFREKPLHLAPKVS